MRKENLFNEGQTGRDKVSLDVTGGNNTNDVCQ